MDIRRLVRGTIDWDELESVAVELADRLDREEVRITFLDADNWSSIPFVIDEDYFVKVITPQNALVHALFTGARNLGVLSSGSPGFFDRYDSPIDMAEHEVAAIERMREAGLNAPAHVDTFEHGRYGVVVMEYLPDYEPLSEVALEERTDLQESLFATLATMHDHGVVHGDLRAENVLVFEGELYIIDATLVSEELLDDAKAYDLASALAIVASYAGAKAAVELAEPYFDAAELLAAHRFLDFVNLRPDHDFDAVQLRGEIESHAS